MGKDKSAEKHGTATKRGKAISTRRLSSGKIIPYMEKCIDTRKDKTITAFF